MTSTSTNAPLYLVTGAAGYVGSELVRHLAARGERVRAMARRLKQLAPFDNPRIEPFEGDIRDRAAMDRAMAGVAGVYHIAALFRHANVPDSAYRETNLEGTRNVMEAAIAAGVPRLIHCSTIGVLGHVENPPADETTEYMPADLYQVSKMEGEKLALELFRSQRIGGVVIRPAMIYGPGDTRLRKIFRMIAHRRFFYVGRGDSLVHFIDVRDLARAFILAMEHTERNGEIYIIAGERAMPLKEFAEEVAQVLQVPPPWLRLPVRPMQMLGTLCEAVCVPLRIPPPIYRRRVDFYTKSRSFATRKAQQELGFAPRQGLQGEIRDIIADYRQRGWL
ncbi:MAG: NAD-dependent epimerase/dehydratase family protein [Lentisphaerae bacterium]|jgi:nucleoside-diphosphate-sugar epimerase|nr:NAD-dependent epimerase/dehydratase family protein [Lentisphaerota bacterium]